MNTQCAGDDLDDALCRYPSKPCENPRVAKRNGELHRFCDYHRRRANENQRGQDERRKERSMALQQLDQSSVHHHPVAMSKPSCAAIEPLSSGGGSPQLELDGDDLRVLSEILFDGDAESLRVAPDLPLAIVSL